MRKIFYITSNETQYELDVDVSEDSYCPRYIYEDVDGVIHDGSTKMTWPSLPQMTQELKIEIISWGSDLAN